MVWDRRIIVSKNAMLTEVNLYAKALGIAFPWFTGAIRLDAEGGELGIFIDLKWGPSFIAWTRGLGSRQRPGLDTTTRRSVGCK
jgi:hypothetical protein